MISSGRRWWPVLAALAVGLALRLAYLAQIRSWPAFDQPAVDAGYHDAWAKAIAFDNWEVSRVYDVTPMRTSSYFRPPGYPFFLAAVYRVCGDNPLYPRIVQAALGMCSLIGFALFARRWYGRTAAWVAVLLASTYWGFIYFEGELVESSLLVFLGVALVACLAEAGARPVLPAVFWALVAGAAMGAHALARPNVLLFAPVAAACLLWQRWRAAPGNAATNRRRPRLRRLLVLLVPVFALTFGCFALVLPVTLRNARVAGEFVPISANGGINLYIGNHDGAEGLFVGSTAEFGAFGTSSVYEDIVAALSRQAGRTLTYGEADRYFAEKGRQWILAHPLRALGLVWRKFVYLCSAWETGHNRSIYWDRRKLPVIRYLPGNWGLLLALSVAGLFLAGGGKRSVVSCQLSVVNCKLPPEHLPPNTEHLSPPPPRCSLFTVHRSPLASPPPPTTHHLSPGGLVLLFVICYAFSFLPFFVTGQYRMPLAIWLCLGAAIAVARAVESARARSRGRLTSAAVVAAATYAFTAVNWNGFEPNLAKWHLDEGIAWEGKDRLDLAEAAYRQAAASDGQTGKAWYNLGCLEMRQGRLPEAVSSFRSALAAGLPERSQAFNNLGNCLLRTGQARQAAESLAEAVAREPENAEFLSNYGTALLACGHPAAARQAFEKALLARPDTALAHFHLGALLWKSGEREAGLSHLRRAVELRPEMAAAAAAIQRDPVTGSR